MTQHAEQLAERALTGQATEVLQAFLANLSDEQAELIGRLIYASDTIESDKIYDHLVEYAGDF